MKSIIITTLVFFTCYAAQAQIEKGTKTIGSTLEGTYDKFETNNQFNQTENYDWYGKVEPTFEYFTNTNFSIGAGMGYRIKQYISNIEPLTSNTFLSTERTTNENYNLSLFVRKFWFFNKKVAFYVQPKLSSFYNENTEYNKVDTLNARESYAYSSSWNHSLTLSAGITYFVSPNWGLKAQTLVSQFNYTNNTESLTILYPNINLLFGINYFFKVKPRS